MTAPVGAIESAVSPTLIGIEQSARFRPTCGERIGPRIYSIRRTTRMGPIFWPTGLSNGYRGRLSFGHTVSRNPERALDATQWRSMRRRVEVLSEERFIALIVIRKPWTIC